jgi:hypothetical protein
MPNGDGRGPWWAKEGWKCRRSEQGSRMSNPKLLELESRIKALEAELNEMKRIKEEMSL